MLFVPGATVRKRPPLHIEGVLPSQSQTSYEIRVDKPAKDHVWVPLLLGVSNNPAPSNSFVAGGANQVSVVPRADNAAIGRLMRKLEDCPDHVKFTRKEQQLLRYLTAVHVPLHEAPNGSRSGTVRLQTDMQGFAPTLTVMAQAPRRKPETEGWYAGDTHLHSAKSDGLVGVGQRVSEAVDAGFDWVAITDHAQMLDWKVWYIALYALEHGNSNHRGGDEYVRYLASIDSAQAAYGLPVLPALEYSSMKPANRGSQSDAHYLVFNPPPTYLEDPSDTWYTLPDRDLYKRMTGQLFVNEFAGNCATSIAHPLHQTYPWFYNPDVHGWNDYSPGGNPIGFEIMSNGSFAGEFVLNPKLADIWHSRLLSGEKIYVTAGSDDHFLLKFGHHWTYVYVPLGTPLDRGAITAAIRQGRTIASTGPFLSISVGTTMIGGTITAAPGSSQTATLVYKGPSRPTQISVCNNGSNENVDFSTAIDEDPGPGFQYTLPHSFTVGPGSHGFVYGVAHAGQKESAYTSPIYIQPQP